MTVNRIIIDVESEEPIPGRALVRLGSDAANFVQAVGTDGMENVDRSETPQYTVHHHVSNDSTVCDSCVFAARDGKE